MYVDSALAGWGDWDREVECTDIVGEGKEDKAILEESGRVITVQNQADGWHLVVV